MTDITDQDRRDMLEWARIAFASKGNQEHEPWVTAARYILDNVDAPARTLAEELAHIIEFWESWTTDAITGALTAATDRAEQIEQERDHFFREVENVRNWKEQLLNERDEAQSDLAEVTNARDSLREDFNHERAEVERLNRERDRLQAQVQGLVRRDGDRNSEMRMLTSERNEALIEVERLTADLKVALDKVDHLTAERNGIATGRYVTYAEVDGKPVQKGEESTAESIDPADVKEEEPYHIYYGVYGNDHTIGVRIDGKWRCIGDDRGVHVTDTNIASMTRLAPAPRVIADPDELDTLPHRTVIRDNAGVMFQRIVHGWYQAGDTSVHRSDDNFVCLPATVLWEPEA